MTNNKTILAWIDELLSIRIRLFGSTAPKSSSKSSARKRLSPAK